MVPPSPKAAASRHFFSTSVSGQDSLVCKEKYEKKKRNSIHWGENRLSPVSYFVFFHTFLENRSVVVLLRYFVSWDILEDVAALQVAHRSLGSHMSQKSLWKNTLRFYCTNWAVMYSLGDSYRLKVADIVWCIKEYAGMCVVWDQKSWRGEQHSFFLYAFHPPGHPVPSLFNLHSWFHFLWFFWGVPFPLSFSNFRTYKSLR